MAEPVGLQVAPPHCARWYSEKLLWLPHAYHAATEPRAARLINQLVHTPPRVVLGSFNRAEKLCPSVLAMWVNSLRRGRGDVEIQMLADPPSAVQPILQQLQALGGGAVKLMPRGSKAEYLSRIAAADLALDSTVANGESTSLDLLWLGPVPSVRGQCVRCRSECWGEQVTLAGELMMDRFGVMASALMRANEMV